LQYVVITLIADMSIAPGQAQAGTAFAAPTNANGWIARSITDQATRNFLTNRLAFFASAPLIVWDDHGCGACEQPDSAFVIASGWRRV
jgi:hypothetical protein